MYPKNIIASENIANPRIMPSGPPIGRVRISVLFSCFRFRPLRHVYMFYWFSDQIMFVNIFTGTFLYFFAGSFLYLE